MDLILYIMELVISSLICGGLVLACEDLMPFKTLSSLGEIATSKPQVTVEW